MLPRLKEKCHYCSKFRSPLEIIHLPGGAKICLGCEQRHIEALAALSTGKFMGACSECGKKTEGPTEMALHFEDGKYRAMCMACDRTYIPKRADLYGDTQFGWEQKLK